MSSGSDTPISNGTQKMRSPGYSGSSSCLPPGLLAMPLLLPPSAPLLRLPHLLPGGPAIFVAFLDA